MTSADIITLYARCIERDANGAYADNAARDQLADAAGITLRMTWCRAGYDPEGECLWRYGDQTLEIEMWNLAGRHAPLTSLDCADSIPMPAGWGAAIINFGEAGLVELLRGTIPNPRVNVNYPKFVYANPADRACAETAARVFANLHAKETQ